MIILNMKKKTDEAGEARDNTQQQIENQNQQISRKRIDNKPKKNQGGCC